MCLKFIIISLCTGNLYSKIDNIVILYIEGAYIFILVVFIYHKSVEIGSNQLYQ